MIVRRAIREDVLAFLVPAFLVYSSGLALSARDVLRLRPGLFAPTANCIAGIVLVGLGLTLAVASRIRLGRSYSSTLVVREDHRLVTHGVYRYVRHPIYLGGLLVCLGVPVYASSPLGLLVMSLLVPLVLNRIRLEEKLLIQELGDTYREYRDTTRKLIPFVY